MDEEDIAALMSEMSRRPEPPAPDPVYPENRMGYLLSAAAAVEAAGDVHPEAFAIPLPPSPPVPAQEDAEPSSSLPTREGNTPGTETSSISPQKSETVEVVSSSGDGGKDVPDVDGRSSAPGRDESSDSVVVVESA
jgi:hypothetical protein